ncbi:hypothetical protein SAMN05445756_1106 [Kytococcus aerolatus]|uniref:Ribbon-helix-helix protein, copG family n=1 Tax=Kytococcus aerolatus TaxID=592308 RepID=A0A212TEI2_9MICO|nr:antitoxin [Kytococcus aerolatus]SNC64413.1 hypothetical protein SAMN05445756_1106 [Kytococcus aerolatus]
MSTLEHRMQLLLDERRITLLRQRAAERGVSVSTVVRDAIDVALEEDAAVRRAEAAARFLELTAKATPITDEPEDISRLHEDMDAELIAKLERL